MKHLWLAVVVVGACTGSPPAVDATPPTPDARVPDAAWPDAAPPDASPPDAGGALPNLTILGDYTIDTLFLDDQFFGMNSCSLEEMCIEATGQRRLLRFSTVTANVGEADLVVGVPSSDDPFWEWGECHGHYHFANYAVYELVGPSGVVATGRKQAFCLEDTDQIDPNKPGQGFTCEYQGISAGWADQYSVSLPCQWIDVTDVPPGDYTLRISINPEQILAESSYDDNVFETAVQVD